MKVAILSAVFNEAAYIQEMIDSVLAQSHTDWELIFVSDGSTDATDDIISARAASDPRIRLAGSGKKIGKVAAFNQAFAASNGDVIVLLAGDDTLPSTSIETRERAMGDLDCLRDETVAYFKLLTMSDSSAHDAMVLPRGSASSHSGGTITLTRALASRLFPIDEKLISEDLWLTRCAEGLTKDVREYPDVVLNYRIHEGNSNPRQRSFRVMSEAMERRHEAWRRILDCPRFTLDEDSRARLRRLATAEELRRQGATVRLLVLRGLPVGDRAAYAAMSSPAFFWLRRRFFRVLSGRRSR